MAESMDSESKVCSICYMSSDFRVLQCGHLLCFNCALSIYEMNRQTIVCPWDRAEDTTMPHLLPTPEQFNGEIFATVAKDIAELMLKVPADQLDRNRFNALVEGNAGRDIELLLRDMVRHRKRTIKHLRVVAGLLSKHERNCSISKIVGSTVGVFGSILTIIGVSLSLTVILSFVGIPLAITGASIGTAGGVTTAGSAIAEGALQKMSIDDVQEDLKMDWFKTEQISILLHRATGDPNLARVWKIDSEMVSNVGRVLPSLAKFGFTTAAGARLAYGLGRASVTAGLHITGLVLAAVVIPLDLAQMIYSSIKIHRNKVSSVVKKLINAADDLEHSLKKYLLREGYFQLVYTIDGYWAYIEIYIEGLALFQEMLQRGCTLDELQDYGEIIESGEGGVPEEIQKRMHDEWYSHGEDYLDIIQTRDGHWAYIEINARMGALLEEKLLQGIALEELREFGRILELGEGAPPEELLQGVQNE